MSFLHTCLLLAAALLPKPQDLYVSSRNTHSVKRFDGRSGEFLGDFVAPRAGGLDSTQSLAFGPDGALYVSGRGNRHILKFDPDSGEFLGPFTSGYELDNPTKMSFGPDGKLYVSQWGETQSSVARFDGSSGAFIDEVTPNLNQGMAHAWNAQGVLFVASFGDRNVCSYGSDGQRLRTLPGSLQSAVNLWFDEGGDLMVLDWQAGSVLRFDPASGEARGTFIKGMTRSEGVTTGPDGELFIADWQQNAIHRYDSKSGKFLGVFAKGHGLLQPNSLIFGPRPKPDSMQQDTIHAKAWQIEELLKTTRDEGRAYHPFLNVPSLHTGIYRLEKGQKDSQSPHDQDELYYVVKGAGKMVAGDETWEVRSGSVLFVAAQVEHRFFDITEDLEILVFFSTGPTQK